MIKYIHIGFPKNFSTSLQRDYFSKHPNIYHLGVGCKDNNLGYVDGNISIALELYLRFAKDSVYQNQKNQIKEHFKYHFQQAKEKKDIKAVGISNEHMSFNFTPDGIDTSQKAYRLAEIFGKNTIIIMIIRNQMDLVRSLYRECLRIGYPYDYFRYIEYLYKFHERNFASDFFFDVTFDLYGKLFGKKNIYLLVMENFRKSGKLVKTEDGMIKLTCELNKCLGIEHVDIPFGHYNEALTDAELFYKYRLNSKNRHDLGNSIYSSAEVHRIRQYYLDYLKISPPQEDDDWRIKWNNIEKAKKQACTIKGEKPILDYACDSKIEERLYLLYAQSNMRLSKMTGINLYELGYPMQ